MNIKILIVEDEVLIAEELAATLEDFGYVITDNVISGEKALLSAQENQPDIVLMDIDLAGEWDGIETSRRISEIMHLPIIYLTAKSTHSHIRRAMSTKPAAFLVKPYNETEITVAIEIAVARFGEHKPLPDHIFLKKGNRYEKIMLSEIIYAEADGSYAKVYTGESVYTISYNLSTLSDRLPSTEFCRVHRSFLVRMDKVTAFEKQALYFGQKHIPIGKAYLSEVFQHFNRL